MIDDAKLREEQKRERCWNPRERWRVFQRMIAWVDAQRPVPRNSKQGCLGEQRRLLHSLRTISSEE